LLCKDVLYSPTPPPHLSSPCSVLRNGSCRCRRQLFSMFTRYGIHISIIAMHGSLYFHQIRTYSPFTDVAKYAVLSFTLTSGFLRTWTTLHLHSCTARCSAEASYTRKILYGHKALLSLNSNLIVQVKLSLAMPDALETGSSTAAQRPTTYCRS
jgi:hypothetical protein